VLVVFFAGALVLMLVVFFASALALVFVVVLSASALASM
jgi:hypothetical protein